MLLQFFVTVGLGLYVLINASSWAYLENLVAVSFLTFSFFVHGCWLEGRAYSAALEFTRLVLAVGIGVYFVSGTGPQLALFCYLTVSTASLLIGRANVGKLIQTGTDTEISPADAVSPRAV